MDTPKLKLEIYQGDPFGCACCGPGATSPDALGKLRKMLTERSQVLKKIQKTFENEIDFKIEIISPKRWNYPGHVRRLMAENQPFPYIFIDDSAVIIGRFPSYTELETIIKSYG